MHASIDAYNIPIIIHLYIVIPYNSISIYLSMLNYLTVGAVRIRVY